MKKIALLGATGSIGRQTLEVITALGSSYRVVALAAGRDDRQLASQARLHRPALLALQDKAAARRLAGLVNDLPCTVAEGPEGQVAVATHPEADLVVLAQVGFSGFAPLVAALRAGKRVALANKESLVTGGELLEKLGLLDRERIIPVDSEHSAIFQCLEASPGNRPARIFLTASGGPFFGVDAAGLARIGPREALRHPTWQMGAKITVDSATLMNKGLEVIEARWLFDLTYDQIEVLIHRQSIIHSMVEFADGSVLAQMGYPDMRLPIQYALTWPERCPGPTERYDPFDRTLSFERPDRDNFPCLDLAYRAGRSGGTAPAALNGANEICVERFLQGRLPFNAFGEVIGQVLAEHRSVQDYSVEEVIAVDSWSRTRTAEIIDTLERR